MARVTSVRQDELNGNQGFLVQWPFKNIPPLGPSESNANWYKNITVSL